MAGGDLSIFVPIVATDQLSPATLRAIASLQALGTAVETPRAALTGLERQTLSSAQAFAEYGRQAVRASQEAGRAAVASAQEIGRQQQRTVADALRVTQISPTSTQGREALRAAQDAARERVDLARSTARVETQAVQDAVRQQTQAVREGQRQQAQQRQPLAASLGGVARGIASEVGGGGLLIGAGLGAAGAAAVATREASRFARETVDEFVTLDRSLRETNSLFGLTGAAAARSFGEIRGEVRQVSQALGTDLLQTSREAYQALSSNVPRENLGTFLQTAGRAALGGATDIRAAGDLISATANQYGIAITDAEHVSDLLFATVRTGRITISELSSSFFQLAPVAASVGVSLEETLAAVATLTGRGVPAAEAMTRIRASMDALLRPSTEAARLQELLGIQVSANTLRSQGYKATLDTLFAATQGNAQQLTTLLGSTEAYQAAIILAGSGSAQFAANLREMQNAAGNTDRAVSEMSRAAGRSFDLLNANIAVSRQRFGELTTGPLVGLAESLNATGVAMGLWPSNVPPQEQVERMKQFGAGAQAAKAAMDALGLTVAHTPQGIGIAATIATLRGVGNYLDPTNAALGRFRQAQEYLDNQLAAGALTREQYTQQLAMLRRELQQTAPAAYDLTRNLSEADETRRQNLQGRSSQTSAILAAETGAIDRARAAVEQWDAANAKFNQEHALEDAARGQQQAADQARDAVDAAQQRIQDIRDRLDPLREELQRTMQAPIQGARELDEALAGVNQRIAGADLTLAEARLAAIRARLEGAPPPEIDMDALRAAARARVLGQAEGAVIDARRGVQVTPFVTAREIAGRPPEAGGPTAVATVRSLAPQVRGLEGTVRDAEPNLRRLQREADAAARQARDAARNAQAAADALRLEQERRQAIGERPPEPPPAATLVNPDLPLGSAALAGNTAAGPNADRVDPLLPPLVVNVDLSNANIATEFDDDRIAAIAAEQARLGIKRGLTQFRQELLGDFSPSAAPTLTGGRH